MKRAKTAKYFNRVIDYNVGTIVTTKYYSLRKLKQIAHKYDGTPYRMLKTCTVSDK